MHNRGKRMCVEAILPSGRAETLNCMYFDFNWHKVYNYADDVTPLLPAGTMLHTILWHDNTANNRSNPDPRNWVGYGQRTMDEMAFSWVTWTYLDEADYKTMVAERAAARATASRAAVMMRRADDCAGSMPGVARRGAGAVGALPPSSPAVRRSIRRDVAGRTSTPTRSATRAARASSRCSRAGSRILTAPIAMWFGYLNRNYEERLNVPVGPTTASTARTWARPKCSSRAARASRSRWTCRPTSRRIAIWSGRSGQRRDAEGVRIAVAGLGSRPGHDFREPRQPHGSGLRRAAQRRAPRRQSTAAAGRSRPASRCR